MKYLTILILAQLLIACGGGGSSSPKQDEKAYIVAGQSNAARCDWSYLEERAGVNTVNIAIGGQSIKQLINKFSPLDVKGIKAKGIIFVHGETDAASYTDPAKYVADVEHYRQSISSANNKDLTLYISTVGYSLKRDHDHHDKLRWAVMQEAQINPKWIIGFNGAKDFPSLGYLVDDVHFNQQGCMVMMDAIIHRMPYSH